MKNKFLIIQTILMAALILWSCSDSENPVTGTNNVTLLDYIFVDQANSGREDGSIDFPFNTLTEAIEKANDTAKIYIAAGTYEVDEDDPLYLKPGLTITGAGRDVTIINVELRDENNNFDHWLTLRDLTIASFAFNRPDTTFAIDSVNRIINCRLLGKSYISHEGGHSFAFDTCLIDDTLFIDHGPGASFNRVDMCTINGGVFLNSGDGSVDSITHNEFSTGGIVHGGGQSDTYILDNTLDNGQIVDSSGAGMEIIRGNEISYNASGESDYRLRACISAQGGGVTIAGNILYGSLNCSGIWADSGPTTRIDSNTVTVNQALYGIYSNANSGQIVGNNITGGDYGLFDVSLDSLVEGNIINAADTGIFTQSQGIYRNNTVQNCLGHGLILTAANGVFEGNTIINNGLIGVSVRSSLADFGGGAQNSNGGNIIKNNGSWDMETQLISGINVEAKNNYWTHETEADINEFDIYDSIDDDNLGLINFVPFLTGGK